MARHGTAYCERPCDAAFIAAVDCAPALHARARYELS
jgi:hypothetical protein